MLFSNTPSSTKKSVTATLIAALLILALAVSLLLNIAKAQYTNVKWVAPKPTTTPPAIFISDPQNDTTHESSVSFTLAVSSPHGPTLSWCNLVEVYYSASWLQDEVYVFQDQAGGLKTEFSDTFELKGIPQGLCSLTVTAVYYGLYHREEYIWDESMISGSSTVTFTVDLKPLRIAVQSPYPQDYAISDLALAFTTNEKTSRLQYCLDGQDNVTIAGNATLTGLTAGSHNITVYGEDMFGNSGNSETISFTVTKPEPSSIVWIATAASAAAIALGIVYFTKRKKKQTSYKVEESDILKTSSV